MFNPLSLFTPLVNPLAWIYFGRELLKASPLLIPVYGIALEAITSFHFQYHPRHHAEVQTLLQLMALDMTMIVFGVYQLVRRRFGR